MIACRTPAIITEPASIEWAATTVDAHLVLLDRVARVTSTSAYRTLARIRAPWTASNWSTTTTAIADPGTWADTVKPRSTSAPHHPVKTEASAQLANLVTTASVPMDFMAKTANFPVMTVIRILV